MHGSTKGNCGILIAVDVALYFLKNIEVSSLFIGNRLLFFAMASLPRILICHLTTYIYSSDFIFFYLNVFHSSHLSFDQSILNVNIFC